MTGTLYVRGGKRLLDIAASAVGLVIAAPLLAMTGLAVKLSSPGPALFRQTRVGRGGVKFQIVKLRSMRVSANGPGSTITSSGDPRITPIGRILRKAKMDELPQLWNVLKGDMSLVGPRPEVPEYVRRYTSEQQQVLSVRPGLTDIASIVYRNEEELLRRNGNGEQFYCDVVMPHKLELNLEYINRMSLSYDLYLILLTLRTVLFPKARNSECCDTVARL
jgi:lipopolysaccharide/colanic/teichoic acid biosynthesis glycosyltransferase